ncbi:unnamed protein product [Amoebophrya sp. A25]|nr:unnamed protein product [Amoebophrya sp. A25]|eukprot:GSA25T00012580001.1
MKSSAPLAYSACSRGGILGPSPTACFSKKFKRPPSPNYDKIRDVIYQKFQPVQFYLNNDGEGGPYVFDQHFKGLLCSPKFEGVDPIEMYKMVEREMAQIGLAGRVRLNCQPPSRFHMLHRTVRKRWGIDC